MRIDLCLGLTGEGAQDGIVTGALEGCAVPLLSVKFAQFHCSPIPASGRAGGLPA